MKWKVYMILCTDNTLYTGITTDVERRFSEHGGVKGAKYFRARGAGSIVYLEGGHDRSSASRREFMIKRMPRAEKESLVTSSRNEVARLKSADKQI